jgi:uncharacterized protein
VTYAPTPGLPDPSASQPVHEVRVLYDLRSPTRDGLTLSCDVFLPTERGRHWPVMLLRTPYETLHAPHIDWAVWWARRGYAVVIQDCRGKYESEGTFNAYVDDGRDGFDALEWIASQPWCDGKIGMSGRSYGGIVQWQVAPLRSPFLTALAPQVIMGDYFGDCHRIGGAVQWALTINAAITFSTAVALTQLGNTHMWGNMRWLRHLPLIDADVEAIGREIPFYREWCAHTVYDDFWRAIDTEQHLDQIDVPAYQQAAWYDPYTASHMRMFNGLRHRAFSEHARGNQKIYVVPWTHHIPEGSRLGDLDFGPGAYVDVRLEDLRWFDYWLKGVANGIMDEPPIRIFVMGENRWRWEQEWPLSRAEPTPYFLHSRGHANTMYGDGTLTPEPPSASEPADRYEYDPSDPVPTLGGNNSTWTLMKFASEPVYAGPVDQRPVERRDDVLVYTSPPLEDDLEVTGNLEVVLFAASSALDTDFTAKLLDVYPAGCAIHLAEGIRRARHRGSLERVELLTPGEASRFSIELAPTSNVFKRGHRLRLEVSSSNFPRFDRNLNTGEDMFRGTRMVVAEQTVLHTAEYPSHILLPVVPR